MEDQVNQQWFERAAEVIDHFEGKLPAEVLEADLDRNDLDALRSHVTEFEAIMAQEEFEASDILWRRYKCNTYLLSRKWLYGGLTQYAQAN